MTRSWGHGYGGYLRIGFLLGALTCMGIPVAVSQHTIPITFERYTVTDGLPSNTILALLQDHEGYLWVGTGNGLVRYDGYGFHLFKPHAADTTYAAGRQVRALYDDGNHFVWLGTEAGLARFDRRTEQFTSFAANDAAPTALITAISADHQGNVWIGIQGAGIHRWDHITERFSEVPLDTSATRSATVLSILRDQHDQLWIGTASGTLYELDPETQSRVSAIGLSETEDTRAPIYALLEDADGGLWAGTGDGLYHRRASSSTWDVLHHEPDNPHSLSHSRIISLEQDEDGYIWAGTAGTDVRGGANRIDPETGHVTRIMHDPKDEHSLNGVMATALLQDHSGGFWVGTAYGGLNYHSWQAGQFAHYRYELGRTALKKEVQAILEDRNGHVWVGTWGEGLHRLNPATGNWSSYTEPDRSHPVLASPKISALVEQQNGWIWIGTGEQGLHRYDPTTDAFTTFNVRNSALQENRIVTLYTDLRDRLWVGTTQGGLYRFDLELDRFIAYPFTPPEADNHWVQTIHHNRLGEIWMGTNRGGAARLDETTGTFTYFTHIPGQEGSLSHRSVNEIMEDRSGTLWFRTGNGSVDRYDPLEQRFESIRYRGGPLSGITALVEGTGHRFWLGTRTDGLLAYNKQAGTVEAFSETGLPHDHVRALVSDEEGHLWISTERGIARFDIATASAKGFAMGTGSQIWVTHRGRQGHLYFGGNDGIIAFHPQRIQDNPYPPRAVITTLQAGRPAENHAQATLTLHPSVTSERPVSLSYTQHDLSFGFTGLHFAQAAAIEYAYMLAPYDADWQTNGHSRSTSYTNLPSGSYTFHIRASNADGVWSTPTGVELVIQSPWWSSWWFLLLSAIAVSGAFYGLVQWRMQVLAARNAHLQRLVHERTQSIEQQTIRLAEQADRLQVQDQLKSRFFTNLSHEFRTPLTLILGPLQQALRGEYGSLSPKLESQMDTMRRQGRYLLHLINQLLDLAKLESGHMTVSKEMVDLVPLLRNAILAFSPLAEHKEITLQLSIPHTALLYYGDSDKITKILNNLLSNAIKFTPRSGWVRVSLTCQDSNGAPCIELKVQDNGPGIRLSDQARVFERFYQTDAKGQMLGTGIGLALSKELADLMGGTLHVESAAEQGSIFTLQIPAEAAAPFAMPEPGIDSLSSVPSDLSDFEKEPVLNDPEEFKSTPSSEITVVVVEDHPEVRSFISDCLGQQYTVLEAGDGKAGWDTIRENKPHVVISDVRMPEMDGLELCKRLKADETLNHIPVILLTAHASDENTISGLHIGADAYLAKPFHVGALRAQVDNLITSRSVLRQRFTQEVTLGPSQISIPAADVVFLEKVRALIEAHMAHSNFSSEQLADDIGLSLRQLNRKLNDLIDMPSSQFIRTMRLERSAQLLEQDVGTVSEIAYAVGYNSASYFARLFKEHFGVLPSAYKKDQT